MKRTTLALISATVLVSACGSKEPAGTTPHGAASTVAVQRGPLSSMLSLNGPLTYRARADASPYVAVNQARGTYTKLPAVGDKVDCGDVLYRVDDRPVLLLCGTVPAYRDLRQGDRGRDVRQLNRTLRAAPAGRRFTARTKTALKRLQRAKGARATGRLDRGAATFLPNAVRIAKVTAELGAPARPGAPAVEGTSDALEVQVQLEPAQQARPSSAATARGSRCPATRSAKGTVDRGLGTVARTDDKAADRRRSRPSSASRTRSRRAGSTRRRSRSRSRPRACRTP